MKELTLQGSQILSKIYIEKGILSKVAEICKVNKESKVCVVTDSNVEPLYFSVVKRNLEKAGIHLIKHVILAGEEYKTLETVSQIYDTLATNEFGREDTMIALGGGVVGDITGFAAATYMRGMKNLIQIPTTLLAQVDSSVGGKCGVDLPHGKNLVGAFRQPNQVLIDVSVLDSLSEDVYAAGMAEVIKYGCIWEPEILQTVSNTEYKKDMEDVIIKCVDIKRQIVEEDETETGIRKILNFGHTVGHGVEKLGNYVDLSHGEAVAVGMIAALKMGESLGITATGSVQKIEAILKQLHLPTKVAYKMEDVYKAMMADKKKQGDSISFIYITKFGEAKIIKTPVHELMEIMKVLSEG